MPRITTVQAAHTYGVLDPHVIERRDTKFIGSSLSDGLNIILLPQGGYTARGGTTDKSRARRKLSSIAITTAILSLPNGGDENALLAGNPVTTAAAAGNRFVVAQCDFGVATTVHMIDIKGLSISTTAGDGAVMVEYWTGSAWAAFAPAQKITLADHSRRFASGAPGHPGVAAAGFRICVDAALAAGTVTLSGLAFWTESAALSDGIVRRYAPEQGMAHQIVLTEGNVDVYSAGVWRAAIGVPISLAQLRKLKLEPKFDTILVWEQTLRPQRLTRLGISSEWACDPIPFANMPRVDYGGVYTNGTNEVQEIQLFDVDEGTHFDLLFEGQTTTAIQRSSTSPPLTADRIKTALEALPNVGSGLTVTRVNDDLFRVEFSDDVNRFTNVATMSATALDFADDYVRVRTIVEGKPAGEDLMSDSRGWPAVGRFAQQRLIMAGLKSRPNDLVASMTGDPFNLNTEIDLPTRSFSYEIDSSENNAIRDMFVGRTLMFYGDQQLTFLKNTVLSADEVPQFGASDTPGIKAETSPANSDNAVFHVQNGGTTLRMTTYTELEQNFVAENASVLSAHLVRNPTDLFRRRAVGAVDADLMMMVNADGSMTVLTLMRTQEVSGFAPWATDGAFRSGCTDHDNNVWLLVERQIDGVTELRLEVVEPDKLLDEAVEIVQPASTTISGLSRFNSRAVWAVANDSIYGPHVVSDGAITVSEPVTSARVGTWVAPFATDPTVSLTEETRARMARLKRVNRAEISVIDTTSIALQVNDGAVTPLPLRSNEDTILDVGPLARPYTGKIEGEGFHGFTDHGKLTVTQAWPGFLTVRSVTKNIVA